MGRTEQRLKTTTQNQKEKWNILPGRRQNAEKFICRWGQRNTDAESDDTRTVEDGAGEGDANARNERADQIDGIR